MPAAALPVPPSPALQARLAGPWAQPLSPASRVSCVRCRVPPQPVSPGPAERRCAPGRGAGPAPEQQHQQGGISLLPRRSASSCAVGSRTLPPAPRAGPGSALGRRGWQRSSLASGPTLGTRMPCPPFPHTPSQPLRVPLQGHTFSETHFQTPFSSGPYLQMPQFRQLLRSLFLLLHCAFE